MLIRSYNDVLSRKISAVCEALTWQVPRKALLLSSMAHSYSALGDEKRGKWSLDSVLALSMFMQIAMYE